MSSTDGSHAPSAAATEPRPTSTTTTEPATERLRASDAEREATVAQLHRALGEGRLDLAETDTRVAAAYAAVYRTDLPTLVSDLPAPSPLGGSAAPSWADIWTSLVWRARLLATGRDAGAPTARDRRTAALLCVAVVVWMLVCALAGAAAVGS